MSRTENTEPEFKPVNLDRRIYEHAGQELEGIAWSWDQNWPGKGMSTRYHSHWQVYKFLNSERLEVLKELKRSDKDWKKLRKEAWDLAVMSILLADWARHAQEGTLPDPSAAPTPEHGGSRLGKNAHQLLGESRDCRTGQRDRGARPHVRSHALLRRRGRGALFPARPRGNPLRQRRGCRGVPPAVGDRRQP